LNKNSYATEEARLLFLPVDYTVCYNLKNIGKKTMLYKFLNLCYSLLYIKVF